MLPFALFLFTGLIALLAAPTSEIPKAGATRLSLVWIFEREPNESLSVGLTCPKVRDVRAQVLSDGASQGQKRAALTSELDRKQPL